MRIFVTQLAGANAFTDLRLDRAIISLFATPFLTKTPTSTHSLTDGASKGPFKNSGGVKNPRYKPFFYWKRK